MSTAALKTAAAKVAAKRIAWIDIARGIGILLVVYGHVLRGLASAHLLSTDNPVWLSDYTIYTFHMPLFFLLAGLQVERSLTKGRWPFLKSKVMTVVYPYLLWSWFQLTVQMLAPKGSLNSAHGPMTLLTILWIPVEQFWFLYVLFLCHFAAFVTRAKRWLLMPLLSGGVAVAVLISAGRLTPDQWISSVAPWLVFYIAGILLGPRLMRWQPSRNAALGWTVGSAAAFAVLAHVCRGLSHTQADDMRSWPATVAGVLLTLSASHLLDRATVALAHWMGVLGRASMTIYIFHVLAAAGTRTLLKKLHVNGWEPQLVLGTVAGVCLPFLLHLMLERMNLLAALGLGAKRRTPVPQPAPLPVAPGLE